MFSTRVCNCTLRFFLLRHGNMEACLPVIWWRRQEINLPDHCCPNLTYSLPKGLDWLRPYGILRSGKKSCDKIAGLPGSLHRVSALPAPPQVANQLPAQVIVPLSTKTCTLTAGHASCCTCKSWNFSSSLWRDAWRLYNWFNKGNLADSAVLKSFFLNLNAKKSTVEIFLCACFFCRMKILNARLQLAFAMRIRFETLPHDLLANDSVTLSFDFYAAIQTSLSRHKGFWPQNCLFISCTLLMDKQQCLKHPHLNWKQNKALKLQVSTKAWFCQQCKISSKMHSSTKSKQAAHCHICRSGVLKIHSEQALLQGLFPKEKTATSFWENCRTSSSFEIPLHAFDGIGLQTRPHLLEIVLVQTHLLVICVLCQKHSTIAAYSPSSSFDTWVAKENSAKGKHIMAQILATSTIICCCVSASSVYLPYIVSTSHAGQVGAEVSGAKELINAKKTSWNACRATNWCAAQNEFFVFTSLQTFRLVVVFWWWLVLLTWWWYDAMWSAAKWLVARWCEVRQCGWLRDAVSCHVMSWDVRACDVVWCLLMWCDLMWCDVMSDAMRCDVMCCKVVWCNVMSCTVM